MKLLAVFKCINNYMDLNLNTCTLTQYYHPPPLHSDYHRSNINSNFRNRDATTQGNKLINLYLSENKYEQEINLGGWVIDELALIKFLRTDGWNTYIVPLVVGVVNT